MYIHPKIYKSFGVIGGMLKYGIKQDNKHRVKKMKGFTLITPAIKQKIKNLLSKGYTKNSLSHELNIGYKTRTTTINKLIGENSIPYRFIRVDVLDRLTKLKMKRGV